MTSQEPLLTTKCIRHQGPQQVWDFRINGAWAGQVRLNRVTKTAYFLVRAGDRTRLGLPEEQGYAKVLEWLKRYEH